MATGMQYEFLVTMEKADGSEKKMEAVNVIALNKAHAWRSIGIWVARKMSSNNPRNVTSVELTQP